MKLLAHISIFSKVYENSEACPWAQLVRATRVQITWWRRRMELSSASGSQSIEWFIRSHITKHCISLLRKKFQPNNYVFQLLAQEKKNQLCHQCEKTVVLNKRYWLFTFYVCFWTTAVEQKALNMSNCSRQRSFLAFFEQGYNRQCSPPSFTGSTTEQLCQPHQNNFLLNLLTTSQLRLIISVLQLFITLFTH